MIIVSEIRTQMRSAPGAPLVSACRLLRSAPKRTLLIGCDPVLNDRVALPASSVRPLSRPVGNAVSASTTLAVDDNALGPTLRRLPTSSSRCSRVGNCRSVGASRSVRPKKVPTFPFGRAKFPPELLTFEACAPAGPAPGTMPRRSNTAVKVPAGTSMSPSISVGTFETPLSMTIVRPSDCLRTMSFPETSILSSEVPCGRRTTLEAAASK
ncbi:hypothetical protein FG93_05177 [Bosea sp. LC85]|nr:hypothetical protein FG93_05177 [Bosea sp. LC85]